MISFYHQIVILVGGIGVGLWGAIRHRQDPSGRHVEAALPCGDSELSLPIDIL